MKKLITWGILSLMAIALMGCIETTTLIRVNRDGSGTIENTVIISKSFMELISSMGGESESAGEEIDFLDEEELKEKALNIGQGVNLISAENVRSDKGSGYKAVYAFKDIKKIRINQNPGENIPSPSAGGSEEDSVEEYILFDFKKGDPTTLTILKPMELSEPEEEKVEEQAPMDEDPAMLDMLRTLYQDMKIGIAVEVQGTIVETNANYREGSRVTIMEMDFGKLLEDENTFKELVTAQPNTLEASKELLKDKPGIKVELEDQLIIRFR